jgi:hypothetical protein
MERPTSRTLIPSRAIAGVVFASASVFLWIVYGHLHWRVLRDHYRDIPASVRAELFRVLWRIEVIYRLLALAAIISCVWSWKTERTAFAVIASIFAVLALFAALSIM